MCRKNECFADCWVIERGRFVYGNCLRKANITPHNSWKYECTNLKILQWNPCYFSCSIYPSTQPDSETGQRKAASGKSARKFSAEKHVLPRLALSPDLNQIEHLWNGMYKWVWPCPNPPTTIQDLEQALLQKSLKTPSTSLLALWRN